MATEAKDYRPLLFGAVGALLTAVFGFMGNLVLHYLTTNTSASLSYSVLEGPRMPTIDGFKEIYVVKARNSGRVELTNLTVRIGADRGKLEQASWRASPGVTGQEKLTDSAYQVLVPLLNPGEDVSLATFMTVPIGGGTEPDVVVRAVGITGVKEDVPSQQKNPTSSLLSAVVTAGVAMFSLTLLARLIIGNQKVKRLLQASLAPGLSPNVSQRESLTYILYACGTGAEEVDRISHTEHSTTYMEFADRLLARASLLPVENRQREILALKCMLLIPSMAVAARKNVKRALRILGTSDQIDKPQTPELNEHSANWRDEIDQFVAKNASQSSASSRT
jgi:hypothetical protein